MPICQIPSTASIWHMPHCTKFGRHYLAPNIILGKEQGLLSLTCNQEKVFILTAVIMCFSLCNSVSHGVMVKSVITYLWCHTYSLHDNKDVKRDHHRWQRSAQWAVKTRLEAICCCAAQQS